jgi:DNA-binding transcriptional ArsR family regulator
MALAMAMVNRGWSWEDFHAALMHPDHEMGRYYTHRKNGAPRTGHDVAARLLRDWEKATELVRTFPAVQDLQEMRQELSMDLAVLKDEVWSGRTGPTDYLILMAAYERAVERGLRELPLASRTLAEKTGVSHRTASRALHRLTEAGELRLLSRPEDGAWVYALVKRQCTNDPGISRGRPPSGGGSSAHSLLEMASSEAFRWLGRYALMVFKAVKEGARTFTEIMERSGVSSRTVWKYLKYLMRDKLISKDAWGYTAVETDDLDELADMAGAPMDLAEEQRRQHAEDRREWRERMARVVKCRRWRKIKKTRL